MNNVSGVIFLIIVITVSLILVSTVNRIQTRNRLIRQKIQRLRRRIGEIEELSVAVEPILESVTIPGLLNDEVIDLINSVKRLDSNANYLDINLEQAHMLSRQLSDGSRSQPLNRLLPSDAAIAKNKYYLTEAARVVRRHQALGRLSPGELDACIQELSWANLMVNVISHIGHGHKAVSRNDPLVAYGYYRKAQNMLINSPITDERRNQFIKQLGEILSNKRAAIGSDLMPETELNPKNNTMNLPETSIGTLNDEALGDLKNLAENAQPPATS